MLSGGSLSSWSLTKSAMTVTVHTSERSKSASGSRVKPVGPLLRAKLWPPLLAQVTVNVAVVTETASLKVMAMLALTETSIAPLTGFVTCTSGASSPGAAVRKVKT